jgi:hypothetical protein
MKWKARYRKKNLNPFDESMDHVAVCSKTVNLGDGLKKTQVEKLAKSGAPRGYELIEVIKLPQ